MRGVFAGSGYAERAPAAHEAKRPDDAWSASGPHDAWPSSASHKAIAAPLTDDQIDKLTQSLFAELLVLAAKGTPAPLVAGAKPSAVEVAKHTVLAVFAEPTGPLPYLDLMSRGFGRHDVSRVRAYRGPAAAAVARRFDARALAVGEHVLFASSPSAHTTAHEAAHVIQQRGGIQPGAEPEAHADAVADLVVRGQSAEALLDRFGQGGGRRRARLSAQQRRRCTRTRSSNVHCLPSSGLEPA